MLRFLLRHWIFEAFGSNRSDGKRIDIHTALDMGIANKSFDPYEQTLIRDTIQARISRKIQRKDVFRKK